jgi:polyphosphate kinase
VSAPAPTTATPTLRALPREPAPLGRYLDRELSWLDFDRRVLELAADEAVPLLERVRLCAIASSNIDEFYAVRAVGLSVTQREVVDASIRELEAEQSEIWHGQLLPALARERVVVASVADCGERGRAALARRFRREIEPLLTPIALGASARPPYVPTLSLNVGALLDDGRFIHVGVPAGLGRFVRVGRRSFVPVEDVISAFLAFVVADGGVAECTVFRVTRDAEFSVSPDADDLLEAVETQLLRRRLANIVRVEIDDDASPELADLLADVLSVPHAQVYRQGAAVGFCSFAELYTLERPELKNVPWSPVTRRAFASRTPSELLAQIRRRDILVHHPYDSFDASVGAFVAAARDPKVGALKATVYRTDSTSPTIAALTSAAADDKQALCLVELKARFDEQRNIDWSRALERAGVDVVFGEQDLKVHAKLALLVRSERGALRRYAHIGTGNYHSSNASNYEDLGLFTADAALTADVAEVFNAVTARARPAPLRKLLVGPWYLRDAIVAEIRRIRTAAAAGQPARIRLKVNALVDREIVDELYAAAEAGVEIDIIARGICVLRPTANIAVRSVLGRFLEHSRIFWLEAGDDVRVWIGSADLMPRNLDRRIEVLVPLEDARLRAEVGRVLDALLADSRFSWELDEDGSWRRTTPGSGTAVSAQELLMERAAKRGKKR